MSSDKQRLTKQGVRDLNPVGHNGHRNHGVKCRHYFTGPSVRIGTRWTSDESSFYEAYEEPVYAISCIWCGETQET